MVCSISGGSSTVERQSFQTAVGGSNPTPPLQVPTLYLEFCSGNDPRYIDIRSRHYVVHKGTHGQQLHFIIWYKGAIAGVISAASAVYATAARDKFFGITSENRTKVLNGIVDNVVFRLENHEKNLGSMVLSLWESTVRTLWESIYGVKVFGFETFIVREGLLEEFEHTDIISGRKKFEVRLVEDPEHNVRIGNLYKASNWFKCGETSGSSKGHDGLGLTGGRVGGKGVFLRKKTPVKDVYCKWVRGYNSPIESIYKSSWKSATTEGTVEEKTLAKRRGKLRKSILGKKFFKCGKRLCIYENV